MLFRALLGLLGDVVGNGDAQLGRRVGVDIQAIVFDGLVGQVFTGGLAGEDFGGHQAGLDAQLDVVQARAAHTAQLYLLHLGTVDRDTRLVRLLQNGAQHAHHIVVRQVGQAVHPMGQQGIHRLGDLCL